MVRRKNIGEKTQWKRNMPYTEFGDINRELYMNGTEKKGTNMLFSITLVSILVGIGILIANIQIMGNIVPIGVPIALGCILSILVFYIIKMK